MANESSDRDHSARVTRIAPQYVSPDRRGLDKLSEGRTAGVRRLPRSAEGNGTESRTRLVEPTDAEIHTARDIGQRVRQVRKAMGMSQQRFADLAGVGRRFLLELEQGKASLEIDRVIAVCHAAGVRLRIYWGVPPAPP